MNTIKYTYSDVEAFLRSFETVAPQAEVEPSAAHIPVEPIEAEAAEHPLPPIQAPVVASLTLASEDQAVMLSEMDAISPSASDGAVSLLKGIERLHVSKAIFSTFPVSLISHIGTFLFLRQKRRFVCTCKRINSCFSNMFLGDDLSFAQALKNANGVVPEVLKPIAHSLRFLDLSQISLSKELAQTICNKFQLERLALGWTTSDEAFEVCVAALKTKLIELKCDLPPSHLQMLSGFSSLRVLDISYSSANDQVLQDFEKSALKKTIVEIRLARCEDVTPAGLCKLSSFTALQKLDLSSTKTNYAVLKAFEKSALKTNLVELRLSRCRELSQASLRKLAGFSSLQSLELGYTCANDSVLQAFDQGAIKTKLAYLGLLYCQATTPDWLGLLAGFPSLREVDLSCTQANMQVFQALAVRGVRITYIK